MCRSKPDCSKRRTASSPSASRIKAVLRSSRRPGCPSAVWRKCRRPCRNITADAFSRAALTGPASFCSGEIRAIAAVQVLRELLEPRQFLPIGHGGLHHKSPSQLAAEADLQGGRCAASRSATAAGRFRTRARVEIEQSEGVDEVSGGGVNQVTVLTRALTGGNRAGHTATHSVMVFSVASRAGCASQDTRNCWRSRLTSHGHTMLVKLTGRGRTHAPHGPYVFSGVAMYAELALVPAGGVEMAPFATAGAIAGARRCR